MPNPEEIEAGVALKKQKEALQTEITALKKQKDDLIESYYEKISGLDAKKIALEKTVGDLDNVIREANIHKLNEIEDLMKATKQRRDEAENMFDQAKMSKDAYDQKVLELDQVIAYHQEQTRILKETYDEAMQALKKREEDFSYRVKNCEEREAENALRQSEIRSRLIEVERIEKAASALMAQAEGMKAQNDADRDQITRDQQAVQARKNSLDTIAADNQQQLQKIAEDNKTLAEGLVALEAKRLDVEALIASHQSTIDQIQAETEKNNRDRIANRAKEITNNQKENALNERERNLKILEQAKG